LLIKKGNAYDKAWIKIIFGATKKPRKRIVIVFLIAATVF
jgi:hypothetical protein